MAPVTTEIVPEAQGSIRNALLSTQLSCSSQNLLSTDNLSNMAFTRSSSRSPSQPRGSTPGAAHRSQRPGPIFQSVDLPSQEEYSFHSFNRDFRMGRRQRLTSEPRYIEKYITDYNTYAPHSNGDIDTQWESTATPLSESGRVLTPPTNNSSRRSEVGELKRLSVPTSPSGSLRSKPEEHPSSPPDIANTIEEVESLPRIDSPQPTSNSSKFEFDEDDDMGDEYHESESDNDSIEQVWVPRDEDFGARVLRATENNSDLAARLGPQLYNIFHEEESSVVGFWEMVYRKRGGNSNDYTAGTPSGGGDYLSTNTGQNKNSQKIQKKGNEDNSEGNNNDNQDGDRDANGGQTGGSAEASNSPPFACPFNKQDPSKYNSSHRLPEDEREGKYKGCETGYPTYQRLREHLTRAHRYVQCENCSKIFTEPQNDRPEAFQIHRLNNEECHGTPPPSNEGITELQWIRIHTLPRQSRFKPSKPMSKHQLDIAKWNHVWSVLFPGQQLPLYYKISATARIGSLAGLEKETAEFANVYDFVINDTNQHLTEKEKLVLVFQTYFFKRRIDLREALSQITFPEYTETQNAHPMMKEGSMDLSISYPGQGGLEKPRYSSLPEPLQNCSSGQQLPPTDRSSPRRSTDPDMRHQGLVHKPGSSQQPTAHCGPSTRRQSLQTMFQNGGVNPSMIYAHNEKQQQAASNPNLFDSPPGLLQTIPIGDGCFRTFKYPAFSSRYEPYPDPNSFNTSSGAQFQQTNLAPSQPQKPIYGKSQPRGYGVR